MAESKPPAKHEAKPDPKPPASKPETKKESLQEKLPPKLAKVLLDEEKYNLEQVLSVKGYKEQKLWRAVTSDGQRHEVSYDGELVSGGHPSKRKDREAAAKKAADKKK